MNGNALAIYIGAIIGFSGHWFVAWRHRGKNGIANMLLFLGVRRPTGLSTFEKSIRAIALALGILIMVIFYGPLYQL